VTLVVVSRRGEGEAGIRFVRLLLAQSRRRLDACGVCSPLRPCSALCSYTRDFAFAAARHSQSSSQPAAPFGPGLSHSPPPGPQSLRLGGGPPGAATAFAPPGGGGGPGEGPPPPPQQQQQGRQGELSQLPLLRAPLVQPQSSSSQPPSSSQPLQLTISAMAATLKKLQPLSFPPAAPMAGGGDGSSAGDAIHHGGLGVGGGSPILHLEPPDHRDMRCSVVANGGNHSAADRARDKTLQFDHLSAPLPSPLSAPHADKGGSAPADGLGGVPLLLGYCLALN
jgi:hypothetical protein